jgi:hypothetical protein
VVEIINIFKDEYPERIKTITLCIFNHDLINLRKAAHAFKGVISNFDMEGESYRLIKDIEIRAHRLEDEINEGRKVSETEIAKTYADFENTFVNFKAASAQLLVELIEIQSEYKD